MLSSLVTAEVIKKLSSGWTIRMDEILEFLKALDVDALSWLPLQNWMGIEDSVSGLEDQQVVCQSRIPSVINNDIFSKIF